MYQTESIHRYPRQITLLIEGLSTLLVLVTSAQLSVAILRGIWDIAGRDETLIDRVPLLRQIVSWIEGPPRIRLASIYEFLPALLPTLGWLALALFVALILRNALPTVRTSSRGMLVEFAGSWLPVPWEQLQSVKVTSDVAGERFVLLALTSRNQLTTWHRIYSLFYGRGLRPGFYITSAVADFDHLMQTVIDESERTARAKDNVRAVRIEEDAQSPIFKLLLSPASFFSRQAVGDMASPAVAAGVTSGPVRAVYPARITTIVSGLIILLAALALWRYLDYWARALALLIPALRGVWPFNGLAGDPAYAELYAAFRTRGVPFFGVAGRSDLPAPWWLLLAAHLMLPATLFFMSWLRNLLPALESRDDGMAVRVGGAWRLIPWAKVSAFKASDLSEQSQILLLQARGLPVSQRLTSLLYDGSAAPGALITSAVSNYQALLQHAIRRITPLEEEGRPPILQQDARSPLIWLAFRRREALAELCAQIKSDPATKRADVSTLLRMAGPMATLALPPALMLLAAGLLDGNQVPGFGLLFGAILLWLFGMLEWPLVAIASVLLDDNTGGGEEGYRAFYVYPTSQLPRLLPLLAALAFQIVGAPALPALAWLGAIAWAFWLAGGLFEQLYEWKGTQVILGGLLPVIWQLLLLLGFLIAAR